MLDDELRKNLRFLETDTISTYPDYDALKKALAEYVGVNQSQVIVGAGSDAIIEHIARQCAKEGLQAVLPVPTFYGYEAILGRIGIKTVPVTYEEEMGNFKFPLEKTVRLLQEGPKKVLFLCNPNNPLGCALTKEEVSTLLTVAKETNTLLVSDEAYFEFSSGASLLTALPEYQKLIIIRTLSKAFALAGARVGYAISAPETIETMSKFILPWPIAHASVDVALAALSQADKIARRRSLVVKERDKFVNSLKELPGLTVYPSETNFVLVRVPDSSHTYRALLKEGIQVAEGESMTQFPEAKHLLQNTLRIAVPSPDDFSVVTSAISRLFPK